MHSVSSLPASPPASWRPRPSSKPFERTWPTCCRPELLRPAAGKPEAPGLLFVQLAPAGPAGQCHLDAQTFMSGHLQVFSVSSSALPPNWRDIVQEEEAKATICHAPSLVNGKLTAALAATTAWMKTLEASHDRLVACGLATEEVSLAEKLQRSHQEGHTSSLHSSALRELQCKWATGKLQPGLDRLQRHHLCPTHAPGEDPAEPIEAQASRDN